MSVKFNVKEALKLYKEAGYTTSFPNSLEDVLKYMQKDKNLNTKKDVAYLLATAKVESDYSLQRWESDFQCGKKGIPYLEKPCKKALDYYRATKTGSGKSKKNYYTLGTDKRGLPYFGRGLIQLTGKSNYKKYGDIIGVDLVGEPDYAMIPKNSYKIASAYFVKRNVFKNANAGNLRQARINVNGGTKGVDEANKYYKIWLEILNNPKVQWNKKANITKVIVISAGIISVFILGFSIQYAMVKNSK